MGTYIYPIDSDNFDVSDYGSVIEDIRYWVCKRFHPFICGDFNSRKGDFNALSARSLKWQYNANMDNKVNGHGHLFSNMCELLQIFPLNHCVYKRTNFEGDYTFSKAGKKSQILTNKAPFKNDVTPQGGGGRYENSDSL